MWQRVSKNTNQNPIECYYTENSAHKKKHGVVYRESKADNPASRNNASLVTGITTAQFIFHCPFVVAATPITPVR